MTLVLDGWTGNFDKLHENNIGIICARAHGKEFQVYFDKSVLFLNGQKCTENKPIQSFLKLGTLVHFNAEKLKKPCYKLGPEVWYKAILVWIGKKPENETSICNNDLDYTDIGPDEPDIYGHQGIAVEILNKSTAVLKFLIENKEEGFVAVERCRLYVNNKKCTKDISCYVKIGDVINFEAYKLKPVHISGIGYQANAAWLGSRPDLKFPKPSHNLNVPCKKLFPLQTNRVNHGGAAIGKVDKSTSTRSPPIILTFENLNLSDNTGLCGYVIAIPSSSTAVLKTDVDNRPVLVALEKCRLFIHQRACPADIKSVIRIGAKVYFEAVQLPRPMRCGVEFRTALAWIGKKPEHTLPCPTHNLQLPNSITVDIKEALASGFFK